MTKKAPLKTQLFATALLCTALPAAYASYLTITNNTSQPLTLVNPNCDPIKANCPNVTPHTGFQTQALCPSGKTSKFCPNTIRMISSNASDTIPGYVNWYYAPDSPPQDYNINIQDDPGSPCSGNITDNPPPTNPCFCEKLKGNANKYGSVTVSTGEARMKLSIAAAPGAKEGICQATQSKPKYPATYAPYQTLNIGENYFYSGGINKNKPVADLAPYFAAQGVVLNADTVKIDNISGGLSAYLSKSIGSSYPGKIYLNRAKLEQSDFDNLSCKAYVDPTTKQTHPLKKVCPMTFTSGSTKVEMPIIVNNSLRNYKVSEVMAHAMGPEKKYDKPFQAFEVSAKPSDLYNGIADSNCNAGGKAGPAIAAMPVYFSTDGLKNSSSELNSYKVNYTFSGENVTTNPTSYGVVLLQGVNAFPYRTSPIYIPESENSFYFATSPTNHITRLCYDKSKLVTPGIYQINVKATADICTAPNQCVTDTAYQTFYVNVNSSNPSLSEWIHGAYASTNLFVDTYRDGAKPNPVIGAYTYSAGDAASDIKNNNNNFISTYTNYAIDLSQINLKYASGSQKITTMLAEIMQLQFSDTNDDEGYQNAISYWPTDSNGNVYASYIGIDQPDTKTWLPNLTTIINTNNMGLTINFAFSNDTKAAFSTFNDQQTKIATDYIMQQVILNDASSSSSKPRPPTIDGVSLDLEGGYNSPGAVEFFKKISDKLAYQGKWFGMYYFATMFTPDVIASFGPLGQGLISGYDVASYRGVYTKPDMYKGWSTQDIDNLKTAYTDSMSCYQVGTDNYNRTKSWCNTNLNDTTIENTRLWTTSFSNNIWSSCKATPGLCTPQQAFTTLNGKFQVIFPVSYSATMWSFLEIFKPDFSMFTLRPNPYTDNGNTTYCSKDSGVKNCPADQQGLLLTNSAPSSANSTSSRLSGTNYSAHNPCQGTANSDGTFTADPIDNNWLSKNEAVLDDPTNTNTVRFQKCIANNITVGPGKVAIQSYDRCGCQALSAGETVVQPRLFRCPSGQTAIPYNQCILMSSLPGNIVSQAEVGEIVPSSQSGYQQSIIASYTDSSGNIPKNLVGVSLYAFENFESAPNGGAFLCSETMTAVQQPWYIGVGLSIPSERKACGKDYQPYDPFYDTSLFKNTVEKSWQTFFSIQNTIFDANDE